MIVNSKNTTILIEGLEQYTDTPLVLFSSNKTLCKFC